MAEALVRRGLRVALVEQASEVMGTLDRDMGALVSAALRETGDRALAVAGGYDVLCLSPAAG